MDYQYFENEGAFYRTKPDAASGFVGWIDDVWTPDGWKRYMGDKFARWTTVSRIDVSKLPEAARPKRIPVNLAEGGQGKSFLLLSHRGTPPPLAETTKPAPTAPIRAGEAEG